MWALNNRTSYVAERNWIRDKQGVHHWLVAVKATFDIGPTGKVTLSDEQLPPLLAPEYRGDPATTSLRLDSDLLAAKPGTDVLLDACAYAPKGKPAATVPVSLRIGDIEKTLLVHGTRVYYRGAMGLATTSPLPFTTRPIHYEWAFGGMDTSHPDARKHRIDARNPVGKGFTVDAGRLDKQPAHAVEYPNRSAEKVGPAGFGPIDRSWSPRLDLAGTYDLHWEKTKKPLLPDDYDERFALSAPADQRSRRHLLGGEPVAILNMTPEGTLRFELPNLAFGFATHFGSRAEEHGGHLTGIVVEPKLRRLTMVWQASLRVPARQVEHLDETTIVERQIR